MIQMEAPPPPEVVALCQLCGERGASIKAALTRASVIPILAPYAMHRQVASAIARIVSLHRPSQQALSGCVQELAFCGMIAGRAALSQIVEGMTHISATIRRWHSIDPSVYHSVLVMALHASMMRVRQSGEFIRGIINVKGALDRSHVSSAVTASTFGMVFDAAQQNAYFQVSLYCPCEMARRIGKGLVQEFVTKPQLSPLMMVLAPHLEMSSYTANILDVATKKYPVQRHGAIMALHTYSHLDSNGRVASDVLENAVLIEELTHALDDTNDDLHSMAPAILLQLMLQQTLPSSVVRCMIDYFQKSPAQFCFKMPESIDQARSIVMVGTILGISDTHLDIYRRQLYQFEEEFEQKQKLLEVGIEHLTPPDAFHCPVTREVMRDPVVASDGHSYERDTLVSLIRGKLRSPLTREVLNPGICVPNINLKKRIREYSGDICDAVKVARTTNVVDPLAALMATLDSE